LAGRPNIGWEYDITEDLILTKINNWAKCIKNRSKWNEVGEKAKPFKK